MIRNQKIKNKKAQSNNKENVKSPTEPKALDNKRVCSEYDAAVVAMERYGRDVLAVSRAEEGYWVRSLDGEGYIRDTFIKFNC